MLLRRYFVSKITSTLFMLSALSLCTLMTIDVFGCQKRELSIADQLFGCKRKRLDQGEMVVHEQSFPRFCELPHDFKYNVVSYTDTDDLDNFAKTNKEMHRYVLNYSSFIFEAATKHDKLLRTIYERRMALNNLELNNKETKNDPLLSILKMKSAHARANYGLAQESHKINDFGDVVMFSDLVLAVKAPRDALLDVMIIDN